ncbi:MAG TPA: phosphatidylglycerol lysyltransferase domain-containing protein, partial [Acidimicrobiales bacterium]|nr:phosphatidylglycerol lysyltransferase domain-containing protein [Acidimicrobiales bacterium]
EPAALSRFVASRLVYRRLGRSAWLLLVPVVAALVLRVPGFALHSARRVDFTSRVGIAALAAVVEILLLLALAVAALRRTGRALSALSLEDARGDPNDAARSKARDLVTSGHAGLITGHTCRPELTDLGAGFYANAGCGTEVVTEYPTRVPGLGLPPVFLGHRQLAWVELEAGNDLHLRLLHGRQNLPGATLAERLLASRPFSASAGDLHAGVVASWPQGQDWPVMPAPQDRDRRVRRLAAFAVFVVGFLSLLSALAEPLRSRLNVLRDLFPLAIPETAASLAALGGIGLMVLARGIRRGQRRAWIVCEGLLIAVAVLHVVKGVDVEEALIALAAGAFLWVYRSSFEAKTDVERVGRGVVRVVVAAALTVLAGALSLQLSSWVQGPRRVPRLSWGRAVEAALQRMVGLSGVALPDRVNDFFSPAMATAAAGLLVALLFVVFRPVVQRQLRHSPGKDPAVATVTSFPAVSGNGDLARARSVVERYGKGTLDYFALRPDKQFFFWGETVVAHAVYGSVCLVSPDPIGPVAERSDAWRAFRRYVDEHSWALGGLGAGEEWLPIYRSTGMHDLYVGDEAIVRVGRFSLEGGRFKGLRQAVNRIAKYGYTITFHDPSSLDPALRCALEDVMTKSRRGEVERGFSMTLGRAFDPADAGLLLAVVHDPAGVPVAFCQYVPAPGIGGYSLDLMRRDNGDHPNGLIDFAVVETIRELQRRGFEGLGLNFATMRAVLAGETGEGVSQRVQGWVLRRMGDSMQIESLWRFNAKFDPDWHPRYAIYDAPENMLAVAIAVARAESFWELPVIGRFLVPPAPVA